MASDPKLNRTGKQKQSYLETTGWTFLCTKDGYYYFTHGNDVCKMDSYGTVKFISPEEKKEVRKNAM